MPCYDARSDYRVHLPWEVVPTNHQIRKSASGGMDFREEALSVQAAFKTEAMAAEYASTHHGMVVRKCPC